ncbi:phytanoyl-CoA dioxygenase family protein [Streptomyces chartreusis]|uniref:Phytanoyl-CoA dioxygenase family protein n=1 Tax=Streptomyces chartreusis TaxID=1969 RepID=A0A7H8T6I6_STRCX|nr:phytanoyl-CoA dioxygenase family protein [Streptomyces chartreusis]QKZ18588.1 phytanoyl-CoA dioxygenase family protein [Streptomyces chartreusis]
MTDTQVEPFFDATPLLDTPAALLSRLHTDGYLYLRGVLPVADVAAVRRHVLAVADHAGWLLPATADAADPPADPHNAVWDPAPAYRTVHRQMWTHRDVHALMHHPRLLALLTTLTGHVDVLVHPRKVLRAVHPRPAGAAGASAATGWHQDFPEIQGSDNTLTVWTPLAPAGPGTGALAVLPASHRGGVLPLRLAATAVGWEADVYPQRAHTGHVSPGDVLIFTAHTVHRGTANTGRSLRLSLDVRYQPAADPVNETCLELRDEPFGWDSVYDQWAARTADPLAYYWQRHTRLDVVPYDTRFDHWREQTALTAGERRDPTARRALEITAAYSAPPAATRAATLLRALPTPRNT